MGWIITVAYFVAAWLCFDSFRRGSQRVWLVMAVGMLLLGLNKQLDAQVLLREIGSYMAHQEGWFAYRRIVQAVVGSITIALSAVAAWRMFLIARRSAGAIRWAVAGSLVLLAFFAMHVASFGHLGMPYLGDNFDEVMEFGGVMCVAGGAWRWRRKTSN